MRKNDIIFIAIGVILFFMSIVFVIYRVFFADIWAKNADKLNKELCKIEVKKEGSVVIKDMSKYVPFEWDTLYVFKPDVSIDKIFEIVGYKFNKITKTTNEGMNQLVFLKDGKVVCYVYGYPKARKVFFDFKDFEGDYFTLTKNDKIKMRLSIGTKGIRTFEYIKE